MQRRELKCTWLHLKEFECLRSLQRERIELHMVAFEGFVMPEDFAEDTRTQIGNLKVCIISNYF